mmetsp:Transcript_4169/g.9020  ORF Transcript_4169/g.9020 Transcript_4169/m.9020 type:complete len:97 (+) Transcript_4169:1766-2056(+)
MHQRRARDSVQRHATVCERECGRRRRRRPSPPRNWRVDSAKACIPRTQDFIPSNPSPTLTRNNFCGEVGAPFTLAETEAKEIIWTPPCDRIGTPPP